jgi:NADH dehydrogenase
MKKKLLIIGGGFAGFWSAMSAIRQSRAIEKEADLEITLVNPDNYLTIRPRLYEASLEGLRVELDTYLLPLGIKQIVGRADVIDPTGKKVTVFSQQGTRTLVYDYLGFW